jgi:hypothetical protein
MTKQDLQIFIDNYSSSDFSKIKFDWNGEHADKFKDANSDFRMQLCELIILQLDSVKIELIRDIYIELSKCAKEAWCVYNKYHLFAQQLLTRGGTKYLIDYLEGSVMCFDTGLASGRVELSMKQKQNIFDYITDKLKTEKDERTIKLLQIGNDRFKHALNVN